VGPGGQWRRAAENPADYVIYSGEYLKLLISHCFFLLSKVLKCKILISSVSTLNGGSMQPRPATGIKT
jgi:hypothetical protein